MPYALPIDSAFPNYKVTTDLDGVQYTFHVRWNERAEAWYLDILAADGDPIRVGLKIVLGTKIGRRCVDPRFPPGAIIARDLSGEGRDAAREDLGTRVRVEYHTAAEVAEAIITGV